MASGARFGRSEAIPSGVSQTMRSAGVQAAVRAEVERIAAAANSAMLSRRAGLEPRVYHGLADNGQLKDVGYAAEVKVGRNDALGLVRILSNEAAHDQSQHHTLDSLNH